MKQYDAIIIGFGKGGKTLAAELAKRKQDVAVVERSEKMYGGTCINIGCIPTKTLVHAANMADQDASWAGQERHTIVSPLQGGRGRSFLRQKNYHNLADNRTLRSIRVSAPLQVRRWWEVGMVEGTLHCKLPAYSSVRCGNRHSTDRGDKR